MSLIYLDTETTGLDPLKHEIWEIAYAKEDGPIHTEVVAHVGISADAKALEVGRYHERAGSTFAMPRSVHFENEVRLSLHGNTLVGANPRFDAAFLEARWGSAPWKYRLFDIEAFAMPAFGWDEPQGLKSIATALRNADWEIPGPDHTARGDVDTLRECHRALIKIYEARL